MIEIINMNFYPFHIGDYTAHTARLDLLEDLAYRRMIDLYYLNERPLNGCPTDVARDIGMRSNAQEVEYVLNKFFVQNGDGWVNKRIESELEKYQLKRKQQSEAGKKSAMARAKKARSTTVSTNDEPTKNQEPRTKNQIDKGKKRTRFVPPSLSEVKELVNERSYTHVDADAFINFYESKNWYVGKNKMKDWRASLAGWESRSKKDASQRQQTIDDRTPSSASHNTAEENERIANEAQLRRAIDAGFESVDEYEKHQFELQMKKLGSF
jgi:uncharacterized protein YdaU (DUF1376 family)